MPVFEKQPTKHYYSTDGYFHCSYSGRYCYQHDCWKADFHPFELMKGCCCCPHKDDYDFCRCSLTDIDFDDLIGGSWSIAVGTTTITIAASGNDCLFIRRIAHEV